MSTKPHDMTPVVDLTYEKGTGPIRARRPIFVDLLPPCNHACPAGEDIQAWLALAQAGRYREAWETLVADNPLPAVHGRVCYHPCETACNRGQLDAAVSIHAVERFLGDLAAKEGWAFRTSSFERQTRARHRRGTKRAVGCLSPRAPGSRGRDPRGRADGRRHDAFRHSGVPAAA